MLDKSYNPQDYEDEIYKRWEESGFFNPDNLQGEPYSIMMPPPNVTGVLHLGHALENTLMDIMIRFERMRGKKTLLLPGTDHAAVATQAKVEKLLVDEGIKNPREELGREELLKRICAFAEDSKSTILSQIKKMGTSCDWSRLAYTFDKERNKAVNEMFIKMYNDGLIYRGKRLVNWSVGAHSVLSDDELEWEERAEPFYYIRCGQFVIGTVRPETKCADSPLVVHPKGEYVELKFKNKYSEDDTLVVSKNLYEDKEQFEQVFNTLEPKSVFEVVKTYKGKDLEGLEFEYDTYAAKRKFYVIADEVIDMHKGAGAMTISSSHSADDYDLAKRRGLDETFIQKIDFDGKMTEVAGPAKGLSIVEARKKAVEIMRGRGLIVGEDKNYTHRVPLCYRSKTVVEPMISRQWFIDVNKEIPGSGKTLKDLMKEAVEVGHCGDKKQRIIINPKRFEKIYYNWINNLRDWCISRQIWWGHRIPVWYCCPCHDDPEKLEKGEYWVVGEEKPEVCPRCGADKMHQDEDTLDTWFSSGTWTFSTLGWPCSAPQSGATQGRPEKTGDLKIYHPTSWMQMGHEILFFWMARMILMSTYALDEIPFKDVYIHGLLRNEQGKKFSKSDGNTLDPLVVTKKYSADALRYSIISGVTPGNDSRFYLEKVEAARNLVTKFWNICRFIEAKIQNPSRLNRDKIQNLPEPKTLADRWILGRLNEVIKDITDHLENYRFSQASELLREFTWSELADWYLEIVKIKNKEDKEDKGDILNYILSMMLKLWHPFMPFVTEKIWQDIYRQESMLMVEVWPKHEARDTQHETHFNLIKNIVIGIRSLRAEYNIEPGKKIKSVLVCDKEQVLFDENAHIIRGLARVESLTITADESQKPAQAAGTVVGGVGIFIDLAGAIDIEKEKARLQKEIDSVAPYVATLEKKLSNSAFIENAPHEVVEGEKEKLSQAKEKLEKLNRQFDNIKV